MSEKSVRITFQKLILPIAAFCLVAPLNAQNAIKQKVDSILQAKKEKVDSLYNVADSLIKEHRVVARIDSIIDKKQEKDDFDHQYIRRPKERWTLKARLNIAGTHLVSRLVNDDNRIKSVLNTDLKTTINFAASYRGIALGLGVNPVKLFKKNTDYELNVNSYGSKFGFDVVLQRTNSLNGNIKMGNENIYIPRGLVRQMAFTTNVYYTLNNRHFSWAAALNQSVEQRKSAGSVLLGASFLAIRTKNGRSEELQLPAMRIYMGHIGIGGGYAYNFIVDRHWLIHGSIMPTFVIINRNNITMNNVKRDMPYYFPNVITTSRFAAIRYHKNYFWGFTAVVNNSVVGRRDHLQMIYTKWRTRLIFGLRL